MAQTSGLRWGRLVVVGRQTGKGAGDLRLTPALP